MSLSDLVQALPAELLQEEHQLTRVKRDSAALSGPCNKHACRALAKEWNVSQKTNGKDRGKKEILNDVEQKIRQEVDRLLRKASGNEGHGKNVSGDQEPGEGVGTVEAVSGAEEPGEGVNTVEAGSVTEEPGEGVSTVKAVSGAEEPGVDVSTVEAVSVTEEPGEGVSMVEAVSGAEEPGDGVSTV